VGERRYAGLEEGEVELYLLSWLALTVEGINSALASNG
jgi:hypothetical protein